MRRAIAAPLGLALTLAAGPAAAPRQEDLSLLGVFISPAQVPLGGTFTLSGNIQVAAGFMGNVTLSVDLSPGVGVIHTFTVFLNGGGLVPFTTTVTAPSTAPTRFLQVAVTVDSDQLVAESNENNNQALVAQTLELLDADLDATGFTGAPTGLAGGSYPVTITVTNVGRVDAAGFTYRIYLGGGTAGPILVSSMSLNLAAGQALTRQEALTLPATPGLVTLTFTVNDDLAVPEQRLNNNLRRLDVQVGLPLPDLEATVSPFNGFAEVGQTLRLSANIQNTGDIATSSVTYGYYLSIDPTLTPQDYLLTQLTVPGQIPAGGFTPVQDDVTIHPAVSPGNYWLGVIVDPLDRLPESDDTNNASTAALLQIVEPELLLVTERLPDAEVGVDYQAQLVARGGAFPIVWSVVQGQLPTGITLTSEGALAGRPVAAGTAALRVRAVSGSATAERDLTLLVRPADPGLVIEAELPPGFVGRPYAAQASATGGGPRVGRGPADLASALAPWPGRAGVLRERHGRALRHGRQPTPALGGARRLAPRPDAGRGGRALRGPEPGRGVLVHRGGARRGGPGGHRADPLRGPGGRGPHGDPRRPARGAGRGGLHPAADRLRRGGAVHVLGAVGAPAGDLLHRRRRVLGRRHRRGHLLLHARGRGRRRRGSRPAVLDPDHGGRRAERR